MKLKSLITYVLFIGIGFLILYLLYQSQQAAYLEECTLKNIPTADCSLMDRIIGDFKSANWIWIVIVTIIFMISNVFRALRWKQIFATENYHPSTLNAVGVLMVGYFANLGLPRVGEVVKMGLLSKYESIPIEKVAASVVIDRLMDILSLLVVIALSVVLAREVFADFLSANLDLSTLWIMGIVAILGGLFGLFCLYMLNRWYKQGKLNNKWLKLLVEKLNGFVESLLSIRKIKNVPLFIAYTMGIWVCYYLMTYWCFNAFAPVAHLGATAGLVVFLFGTLGMVFPSPGGMGSYHFLVIQALLLYGISSLDANSFAYIIFFSINIFCNVFFGLLFLILLPIYNKSRA